MKRFVVSMVLVVGILFGVPNFSKSPNPLQ